MRQQKGSAPRIGHALHGRKLPPRKRRRATDRADKHVQRRTATRRRRVGRLIFRVRAADALRAGVPYEKVIDNLAVGLDKLQEEYQRAHGEKPSRDTLHRDVEAILGGPVGVMPAVWSDHADRIVQANTYTLRHVHLTLGRLGRKLMRDLHDLVLSLEFERPRYGAHTFSPISVLRRAEKALRWALENAVPGNRHRLGVWLGWRLAHLGLPEPTAYDLLTEYQGVVCSIGSRKYEKRESTRAVESAYRKVGTR